MSGAVGKVVGVDDDDVLDSMVDRGRGSGSEAQPAFSQYWYEKDRCWRMTLKREDVCGYLRISKTPKLHGVHAATLTYADAPIRCWGGDGSGHHSSADRHPASNQSSGVKAEQRAAATKGQGGLCPAPRNGSIKTQYMLKRDANADDERG